jgi:hypothetical protein
MANSMRGSVTLSSPTLRQHDVSRRAKNMSSPTNGNEQLMRMNFMNYMG